MAGALRRSLAGALLAGALLAPAAAVAQSGRAWSDPPADLNAGPLVEDPKSRGASAKASTKSADAWPDEAARRLRPTQVAQPRTEPGAKPDDTRTATRSSAPEADLDVKETGSTRTAGSGGKSDARVTAAARAEEADEAASQAKAAAREKARKEAARQRRIQEAREVREAKARREAAAVQRRRALAARNADRVRTAQPEYEVMRLRTLVYPDGRMVEVLTRPDQEIADLPVR
ncbi:MAG TPA: hypothetical protein VHL98_16575 [Microvirga sp.]|jgi:hypothetical protein|nr:hypothetical protein [Microvirga sp.]